MNAAAITALVADWLVALSLQVAVLGAAVALLDRALVRWRPGVRAALWWLVLLKIAVPPAVALPWSPTFAAPRTAPASVVAAADRTGGIGAGAETASVWIAGLWLAGVGLAALAAGLRYRQARRRWTAGARPAPARLRRRAGQVAIRLGLRRLPSIVIHPHAAQPAVVGIRRPVVVLPPHLDTLPGGGLDHVLMHELAHVRRGDPALAAAALAAQLLLWFHPFVWLARRRLATLREMSCDRVVCERFGRRADEYGRTLLRVARPLLVDTAPALGFLPRRSELLSRLEALGRRSPLPPAAERALTVAVICTLVATCLPVARPRPPDPGPAPPVLDALPGSLQKRYAVLRYMAQQEAAGVTAFGTAPASDPERSTRSRKPRPPGD
jgi:beta-lactamase regulating signal transducer with metallopeptidase domain